MAHGGKRKGAGRKVGTKLPQTRDKAAVEAAYRAYMLDQAAALWRSQRERAIGSFVLMVQTKKGLARVTDPDEIEAVVKEPAGRGETWWFIEAQEPDTQLVKEINNRLMGLPTQPVEVGTADGAALPVRIVLQEEKG